MGINTWIRSHAVVSDDAVGDLVADLKRDRDKPAFRSESHMRKYLPRKKPTTRRDEIEAAHDALRAQVQKLVDRFGQAQAFEIVTAVAHIVCPDGARKLPEYICLRGDAGAAN
jgi:hypothetical protein